jgi:RNA polymerase sigma factor (sigma-70 family)
VVEEGTSAQEIDDVTLLTAVRAGDTAAFGTLYQRHEQCARRLASGIIGIPAEVDDAVSDSFARVLDSIHRGGGPTAAFRPYLLTTVRRVCYDRLRGQQSQVPTDVEDMPEQAEPFDDPAVANLELTMIARAFQSLPERWSAVLWHTEIEESSPAELTTIFGLTANGVAALKYRAKEGLRRAYLQEHITNVSRPECVPIAGQLGAFVRKALTKREAATVDGHLQSCDDCHALYAELTDVEVAMRGVVAPLILGGAATSYLAAGGAGSAVGAGAGAATGARAGGAGTAGLRLVTRVRHAPRQQQLMAVGVGIAVVVAAMAALAMTLTGNNTPTHHTASRQVQSVSNPPPSKNSPHHAPHHGALPIIPVTSAHSPAPSRSPVPHPTPSHTPGPHPSPSPSPAPTPTPTPSHTPPPYHVPNLAAAIDVYPRPPFKLFGKVDFRATDTGNAATGAVSASIKLPPGSYMVAMGPSQNWTCLPNPSGADCRHGPVPAGGQAPGSIYILIVGRQACGKPVSTTMHSGNLTAHARSPEGIQCPSLLPGLVGGNGLAGSGHRHASQFLLRGDWLVTGTRPMLVSAGAAGV